MTPDDKPARDRWLEHRAEMTGHDGTAAVLSRRVHPTQEPERVLSKYQKSYARNGKAQFYAVRTVEGFYEMVAQGRPEHVRLTILWLKQQAARAMGESLAEFDALMHAEQEADGTDDPLQLKLAGGDWSVADDCAMALYDQGAKSVMLADRIMQKKRQMEMA